MSDIGLLWSKITILIIEITLELLLHTKYGWNTPNWGRLGLKSPKLHFFAISGSSKFIAYTNIQIYFTGSIMHATMYSITVNNYWKIQKTLIYGSTIPLKGFLGVKFMFPPWLNVLSCIYFSLLCCSDSHHTNDSNTWCTGDAIILAASVTWNFEKLHYFLDS